MPLSHSQQQQPRDRMGFALNEQCSVGLDGSAGECEMQLSLFFFFFPVLFN